MLPAIELPAVDTGPFTFGERGAKSEKGALPFDSWLPVVTPAYSWQWDYLKYVRRYLDQLTAGSIKKLMLFLPPRHGKSEMATVRYAAWRLERNPELRVIIGAYNQTLANKFSRKTRKIVAGRVDLSRERTAVEDWETERGGGVRAVGVGAGITGHGGDLIIIDDPVKNRKEAASATYRQWVWDWYTDDLYTRREPGASMVLIMTRWHEDDLAGRILRSEDAHEWTVVKLPALAMKDDPLGREPGAALCPERFDERALRKIQTVLGRSFHALYQQEPQEQEGDFFKRSWFQFAARPPEDVEMRVRYWDMAASIDGDYTVGVLMSRKDGRYFVEDVVRGQWLTGERNRTIKATAVADGPDVVIYDEIQPGSSGIDSHAEIVRLLAGYTIHGERVTGPKEVRAGPFASQAEEGNVSLVRGAWNETYIDELCSFPNAANDDQVDASAGAFNQLVKGVSLEAF